MALQYYRLRKLGEGCIALTPGADATLRPPTDVGTGAREGPQRERLSKVIEVVKARFGTDFTEADQLFLDQVEEDLVADATLAEAVKQVLLGRVYGRLQDAPSPSEGE